MQGAWYGDQGGRNESASGGFGDRHGVFGVFQQGANAGSQGG
jgi:hypothetical protein